jgi:hypothetical protein
MPVFGRLGRPQPVGAEFVEGYDKAIDLLVAAGIPGIVEKAGKDRYDAVAYVYPDGRVVEVPKLKDPRRGLIPAEELDALEDAKREARRDFLDVVKDVADPVKPPRGFALQCGKCDLIGHGPADCPG